MSRLPITYEELMKKKFGEINDESHNYGENLLFFAQSVILNHKPFAITWRNTCIKNNSDNRPTQNGQELSIIMKEFGPPTEPYRYECILSFHNTGYEDYAVHIRLSDTRHNSSSALPDDSFLLEEVERTGSDGNPKTPLWTANGFRMNIVDEELLQYLKDPQELLKRYFIKITESRDSHLWSRLTNCFGDAVQRPMRMRREWARVFTSDHQDPKLLRDENSSHELRLFFKDFSGLTRFIGTKLLLFTNFDLTDSFPDMNLTSSNTTTDGGLMLEDSNSVEGPTNMTPADARETADGSLMPESTNPVGGPTSMNPADAQATAVHVVMPENSNSVDGHTSMTPTDTHRLVDHNLISEDSNSLDGHATAANKAKAAQIIGTVLLACTGIGLIIGLVQLLVTAIHAHRVNTNNDTGNTATAGFLLCKLPELQSSSNRKLSQT